MLDVKSLIRSGDDHKFLFFWGPSDKETVITKSCLSQNYPCSFFEDGKFYNCAQQYMMAFKARLMGDFAVEAQIMNQIDPGKMKQLGQKVKPFDSKLWDERKIDIVIRGNKLKFSQNPMLGDFLLSTSDKILVDANPYDSIWGIGLKESDPKAVYPSHWNGQNLLGFALMEVRYQLQTEKAELEGNILCGVTPEKVTKLSYNDIFVFGSNLKGHHNGGAAQYAWFNFWAEWGEGVGLHRRSYAIPTMQGGIENIRPYVDQFISFASYHPHLRFLVTKIGCGTAGYKVEDITPLFKRAISMKNISLPQEFIDVIHPRPKEAQEPDDEIKEVISLWSLGVGNMAKAFNGEDPMPDKSVTATADSWHTEPMPEQHATVHLNHIIPTWAMQILLKGHIPDAMEDHWFMYCDDKTIRYYRSWTGLCIYVANYEIAGEYTRITTLQINRDKDQYSSVDDKKDTLIFLYMLTSEYGGDGEVFWKKIYGD